MFSIFCLPTRPCCMSSVAIVFVGGPALQNAARSKFLFKIGILRIVRILGLLFGVEVIEVAEELIETMDGRQEFVTVAKMVFAKLSGGVSQAISRHQPRKDLPLGDRFGSRQSNFG